MGGGLVNKLVIMWAITLVVLESQSCIKLPLNFVGVGVFTVKGIQQQGRCNVLKRPPPLYLYTSPYLLLKTTLAHIYHIFPHYYNTPL